VHDEQIDKQFLHLNTKKNKKNKYLQSTSGENKLQKGKVRGHIYDLRSSSFMTFSICFIWRDKNK